MRICKMCHKKNNEKLCRSCKVDKTVHDQRERERLSKLRKSGWVPPVVETIRTRK